MSRRIAMLFLTSVLAAGCASSGSKAQPEPAVSSSAPAATASQPRRSTNIITADELMTVPYTDLYAAIQRLRPNFLMSRGGASMNRGSSGPVVYMGESRLGDLSTLKQILPAEVKEVRYLSPSEATQRFGTGVRNGAIVVIHK